jgi:hypothetical protein
MKFHENLFWSFVQCGKVERQTDRQDDEANSRFSQVICEKLNFGNNGSHVETTLCEVWTIGGRGEMYNEAADCVAR